MSFGDTKNAQDRRSDTSDVGEQTIPRTHLWYSGAQFDYLVQKPRVRLKAFVRDCVVNVPKHMVVSNTEILVLTGYVSHMLGLYKTRRMKEDVSHSRANSEGAKFYGARGATCARPLHQQDSMKLATYDILQQRLL
jgi:hypothetical protein